MARVKDLTQIEGALGNLSFYTRHDTNKIIVRGKGGASKTKISNSPAFANLRKHNLEFGGVANMCKNVRMTFSGLQTVADHNLTASLNKTMRSIQACDTNRPKGERSIMLSQYRQLLQNYEFCRQQPLSSMWRVSYVHTALRDEQMATVQIPAFDSKLALNIKPRTGKVAAYTHFRLRASLGIATDMQLDASEKRYETTHDTLGQGFCYRHTEWHTLYSKVPAYNFDMQLNDPTDPLPYVLHDTDSLILTLVLELGIANGEGEMETIRNLGGGLIVAVF